MRTPRTLISLLLVMLMLVSAVAPFASFADNETDGSQTTTTTTSKQLSDEELPSSVTLVGTKHLPPISNQGAIGSCASQSITYEQMTNAVSRYLHSIDPDIEWDPSSGELKYLMSPKFTYDLSGSGTAWVYNILLDHGITTMDKLSFQMNKSTGAYQIFMGSASAKNQYRKTVAWYVGQGDLLDALKIRLINWDAANDQIWVRRNSFNDENGNVMITKTEEGKALLNRIKNSLNNGNVVVTGGLSGAWRYDKITADGDIGKKGETCLSWAHSNQTGGHQVSIVGYDDNIECTINGATMKGAFLVANSWGTSWENDGYVWLMYDALNSKSEFDAINEVYPDRYIAMDQFCFTEWDTDIAIGLPELMVQVEVETVYRESVAVYLTRSDGDDDYEDEKPMMFNYGLMGSNYHSDYEIENAKYTFSGKIVEDNTAAETGYFTLAYGDLLDSMEEGKSFDDYKWGCRIYSVHGYPIVIKSVKLINSDETVIAEANLPDGGVKLPEKETTSHSSKKNTVYPVEFEFSHCSVPEVKTENYTVEYLTETEYIAAGNKVSFKLNTADGFEMDNVTVNGQVVEAVDGVYTFTAAENNVITVAEKAPETTPTPTEPATTVQPTDDTNEDASNYTTIIVMVVVIAVVVIGAGVAAVVVISKKRK